MISGSNVTIIPNSVDTIADYSFYGMYNLRSIDIPNSVKYIGKDAFDYCYYLHHVKVGDSVTVIGDYAFSSCNGLYIDSIGMIDLKLGKAIKTIGCSAFERCKDLPSVVFQDSINYIGDNAFSSCKKLTSVTCKALIPPTLGSNVFYAETMSNGTLYVPMRTIEDYRNADGWKDFAQIEGIYLPVDANADGKINVSDINAMLNRLLSGEEITDPVYDMNCDGAVNVTDVMLMINYIMTMTE